jgi:hypothetical protein
MSIEAIKEFNTCIASTNGRDKIGKLLQYGAKLMGGLVESGNLDPELNKNLQAFEGSLSAGRRYTRFWRYFAGYISFLEFLNKKTKSLEDILDAISKFSYATYFLYDNIFWASSLKILPESTGVFSNSLSETYSLRSNKFWLVAVLFEILLETTNLLGLIEMSQNKRKSEDEKKIIIEKKNTKILKLVSCLCDFGCALSASKYWNASRTTLGLLGTVASIIGVYDGKNFK